MLVVSGMVLLDPWIAKHMKPIFSSANRFPLLPDDLRDLRQSIEKYIFPDYVPAAPFLHRGSEVITVGSCFAEHIADSLARVGMPAKVLRIEEANNTPRVTNAIISKIVNASAAYAEGLPPLKAASLMVLTLGVALQRFWEST